MFHSLFLSPARSTSHTLDILACAHWGMLPGANTNRGKFGTVYKCQEKSTGLKLAAKFVPIPKRDDRRNVEREVEIMNSLQHPLIIQLYDAYEYGKMMCVVLEL